ncbi:MAG: hypothetical protein VR69_00795 [Peptococcaceae bacterium BRH_c4b]|nr:MAG: hypothetical protein VR69_00795 [Peptococcaceae bacterium BRH_c4b]
MPKFLALIGNWNVNNRDVKRPEHEPFKNVAGFLMSIAGTMMDAHDSYHREIGLDWFFAFSTRTGNLSLKWRKL